MPKRVSHSRASRGAVPDEAQRRATPSDAVVNWFRRHGRNFPWRNTRDAFCVLVAEVLLRQTQAHRVVEPYCELTTRYPDAHALAQADVAELRRWFRPLGLVSRADLLVRCARVLATAHSGGVPADLRTLESLPGIGRYSARAILCLGFGIAVPMIDEGSGRVLRRILGKAGTGPAYADADLLSVAQRMLPPSGAREFNLGLLDIGSLFCHPRRPDCAHCPLRRYCEFAGGSKGETPRHE